MRAVPVGFSHHWHGPSRWTLDPGPWTGTGRNWRRHSADKVLEALRAVGAVLGKHSSRDVAKESRFAHKDIGEVMEQQKDLVRTVNKLRAVGCREGID